jgi:hypothetical protein
LKELLDLEPATSPRSVFALPANFKCRIFEAIAQQINPFIARANPFAEHFCYIDDLIQNSIQMENAWLQQAKFLRFDAVARHPPGEFRSLLRSRASLRVPLSRAYRITSQLSLTVRHAALSLPGQLGGVAAADFRVQVLPRQSCVLTKIRDDANQVKRHLVPAAHSPVHSGISTVLAVGITVDSAVPSLASKLVRDHVWSRLLSRTVIIRNIDSRFLDGVTNNWAGARMAQMSVVGIKVVSTL